MKFFDKLVLKVFSIIVLVIGVLVILVMTNVLPIEVVINKIAILSDLNSTSLKVLIGVIALLMLFALKGIFFTAKTEDNGKKGIILENNSGKLVLSKESLENLVASVVKEIPGADSVSSRTILDRNKNLIVDVTANVSKDVMIKDVSNELQAKVKEAMKRTADLDVKEVNIRIKNISSKKVKGLPAPVEEPAEEVTEEVTTEVETNGEEN